MSTTSECPIHGLAFKRQECDPCNAAYMRGYLRRRRIEAPAKETWSRARKRARKLGIPFDLDVSDIVMPSHCPVLGIPLVVGQGRSDNSPSLDRIIPAVGYVAGNVRVISDRANRLKGRYNLDDLQARFDSSPQGMGPERAAVLAYVRREALLAVARVHSVIGKSRSDWGKVVELLEEACTFGLRDKGDCIHDS